MIGAARESLPEVIRVEGHPLIIGREAHVDVRLAHPAVSRRHAELGSLGGQLWVHDLGGQGGVRVNGVLVSKALLRDDDVVCFGPVAYDAKGQQLRRREFSQGIHIVARGLSTQRQSRPILSNVNLDIPPNNFVGILGPSGAGKTTLLKALSGAIPLSAGDILLDGLDINRHLETFRGLMGFVPQEDIVYRTLTVRENLEYALRLRVTGDLLADERATRVQEMITRLGLDRVSDQQVGTLSGGERKRVNVAVELLITPALLFLDEPTSGLDPAAESSLMHFLGDLAHRGTTVICTTHVMGSLSEFDAVMVVARPQNWEAVGIGGRVLCCGPAERLLPHFQCATFAQLYEKLRDLPIPSNSGLRGPAVSRTRGKAVLHRRPGTLSQIATQFHRGARVILRDQALLALLVGQPVVIGLLINLSQYAPLGGKLNILWTFAVIASIWLGLNNTAREVIRDRAVYLRERRSTVNPESYLLSKVLLFALIGLGQVVLLTLLLRYGNFLDRTYVSESIKELNGKIWLMLILLWLTYISAMFLGLLISTLAKTEDAAVACLPLVILPQLLLSGVATEFDNRNENAGHFNSLTLLSSSQERGFAGWLLEGTSLLTYSRPALVSLMKFNKTPANRTISALVNWAHLLFLLLLTATIQVAVFFRRDKLWMGTS